MDEKILDLLRRILDYLGEVVEDQYDWLDDQGNQRPDMNKRLKEEIEEVLNRE